MSDLSATDIEATIATFIGDELKIPKEQIHPDTNLRELPGIESIRVLRIVAKIERAYSVEFDDALVFTVRTPSELASAVRRLRVAGGQA